MKVRSVLTALALVLGALLAPGFGVLTAATSANAATKISHATATSMFRSAGITWSSSGGCSDRNNPSCTSFGARERHVLPLERVQARLQQVRVRRELHQEHLRLYRRPAR